MTANRFAPLGAGSTAQLNNLVVEQSYANWNKRRETLDHPSEIVHNGEIHFHDASSGRSGYCRSNRIYTAIAILSLAAVYAIISYALWLSLDGLQFEKNVVLGDAPRQVFLALGGLFLLITGLVFGCNLILVLGYHPYEACPEEKLPYCTVVVPAYNEGRGVFDTLCSIAECSYPEQKMEIIAIDDGSTDDTWKWMKRGLAELGKRLRIIRIPVNKGKRYALYQGFKKSSSEVLITIDSDCILKTHALRRLVSPFFRDSQIGAVAGNIRVLNRNEGVIPKMVEAVFAYGADFIRTSQSKVRGVLCTPGALSAYRRNAIIPLLAMWASQEFMGKRANIGEDRALAGMILRSGWRVVFQRNALVLTKTPVSFRYLCRMLIRWTRGDIREMIQMTRFMLKGFCHLSMFGTSMHLAVEWMRFSMSIILFGCVLACLFLWPTTFAYGLLFGLMFHTSMLVTVGVIGRYPVNPLWACLYSISWVIALSWIPFFSLCTVQSNSWLTRGEK